MDKSCIIRFKFYKNILVNIYLYVKNNDKRSVNIDLC